MYTITCFSYKGGAGRSTSAANLAVELAKKGKNVVIIDADLNAPGQHHIFNVANITTDKPGYCGTHHLLTGIKRASDIADNLVNTKEINNHWNLQGGNVFLLASSTDQEPALGVSPANIQNATTCLTVLKNILENDKQIDYLIIDSVSGQQPISHVCMSCSNLVFVFFRWTLQHVQGTLESVKYLNEFKGKKTNFNFETVATSVPEINELEALTDNKLKIMLKNEKKRYESELEEVNALPEVQIAEYAPFKWKESVSINDGIYEELATRVFNIEGKKDKN